MYIGIVNPPRTTPRPWIKPINWPPLSTFTTKPSSSGAYGEILFDWSRVEDLLKSKQDLAGRLKYITFPPRRFW